MIIISHRGYWKEIDEKNKKDAFIRSFDMGFGTETDLRDHNSTIVISHDMPKGTEISFEEVLQIMNGRNLPLALNIKADGLSSEIIRLLKKYDHTNYFTFDMSIPDLVVQLGTELTVYTGLSDILKEPVLLNKADGIWLDCFYSDWYDSELIDQYLHVGKAVCVVSADLHKRDVTEQWKILKNCKYFDSSSFLLCTDYPELARKYFYGENKSNSI